MQARKRWAIFSKAYKHSPFLISTQGELQHKMIKHRFTCTNKRNYTVQLAAAEVRERFMWHVKHHIKDHTQLSRVHQPRTRPKKCPQAQSGEEDAVDSFDPTRHYDIADKAREKENILEWLHTNGSDVTTKVQNLSTGTNTDTITHYFRPLFKDSGIIS